MATATSHFILAMSTSVGTLTHFLSGHIRFEIAIPCGIGALLGGQLGAFIAKRLRAKTILIGLSIGIGLLALRLIYTSHVLF